MTLNIVFGFFNSNFVRDDAANYSQESPFSIVVDPSMRDPPRLFPRRQTLPVGTFPTLTDA